MKDWSVGLVQVPEPGLEIEDWWKASISQLPKEDRSRATHVYGLEHLEGKELDDCWRKLLPATQVFAFIKEEIGMRKAALQCRVYLSFHVS